MIIYKQISHSKNDTTSVRYTKNNILTRSDRIPQEVLDKFEFTNEVKYDEQPDKSRCLFCDAPQSHQRMVTGLMIELCDFHYYNRNIGKIVQQIRLESERKAKDGIEKKPSNKRKRKQQRPSK
jgi:hypothetical protein